MVKGNRDRSVNKGDYLLEVIFTVNVTEGFENSPLNRGRPINIDLFLYFVVSLQAQALLATSLSNYRFDILFDYGDTLPDERGRVVISKWFYYLRRRVQPYIERRNRQRLEQDHLSYPYLSPRWIPNGIQT